MKLKRKTLPIQKLNFPTIDLTEMTDEEICEEFNFNYC